MTCFPLQFPKSLYLALKYTLANIYNSIYPPSTREWYDLVHAVFFCSFIMFITFFKSHTVWFQIIYFDDSEDTYNVLTRMAVNINNYTVLSNKWCVF